VAWNIGEHTKATGICTKTSQFSQPYQAAGGRLASNGRLLSGRSKKTFEFALKFAEIAHRDHSILHRKL